MNRAFFFATAGWALSGAVALSQQTPFGIGSCHVNGRAVEDYQRWVPPIEEIGIRYHRSLMSTWGAVEPERGRWSWENVDAQWEYLHDRGFATGALLLGSPAWNDQVPGGHLPSRDLDGWSEYVYRLVDHFRGRITNYEVWNEPPNFTGPDQTAEDYARVVVAAYDAAKKADPDCRVGLTAKSAHLSYLRQVILAGAKDHFDWISLHPYEVLDGIVADTGMEPVFLNLVPSLRKMLAEVDPAKKDVPVMFTELGVDAGHHGDRAQADALVKAYVLAITGGVANVQWFEGRDGDSGPMGLLDAEGKPRPAFHAYRRMIEVLGQDPKPRGWMPVGKRSLGFGFDTENGSVLVAWTPRKTTEQLELPGRDLDFLNATTGRSGKGTSWTFDATPVFVRGLPDESFAGATPVSKSLPPWPGDPGNYDDSRSVMIDVTLDPPERGLHSRAGSEVSAAIVAYGGSARAGDAPGGNLFMVDPSFLSYDRVPLKITAVVRRKDPSVNAGFKLVYESPGGFKTAGDWKTIPEQDEWHTIEWRLDDPCFVNYWGYNFRLESDGPTYSQYLLKSLTVEKTE
ncbi:GH39 family glycosyl hydrolase [Haloferula sargassicola]|uniref:Glycosyl hydrolases family 39 N-terminal catalytic domain-containing protein n=1 Tax=Haloferula sargassicola TaxID=490096 RepID=A0ABP9UUS8_9BACT